MLIKIKGQELLDIGQMHLLVLHWIFNRKSVSVVHRTQLEDSIEFWSKLPGLHKDTKWELKRIVNALIADEKGYWNRSKMLQIEHKVDYLKMYRLGIPFVDVDNRTSFTKP